jgi:Spo0E like sporulation regulatory protein
MSTAVKWMEKELLHTISLKRQEMIRVGEKTGLTSAETLQISQELDEVIVKYQTIKTCSFFAFA